MEQAAVKALINAATATLKTNFDDELRKIRAEAKQQQQFLLQKLSSERELSDALIKQLRESLIGTFKEWITSIKKDISENTFAMKK